MHRSTLAFLMSAGTVLVVTCVSMLGLMLMAASSFSAGQFMALASVAVCGVITLAIAGRLRGSRRARTLP